jgi:diguanylate cyclase (GGDEF)-like protein
MHLDMLTMSSVTVAVTAILGLVLGFTWARPGGTPFVGWWAVAMLLMSAGIVVAVVSSRRNAADFLIIGNAMMILADAIKWQASRQFANRRPSLLLTVAGPIAFLLAAHSGYVEHFDGRLILVCSIMATYNFAAAIELSYADGEELMSRWPAVILLALTGVGFLSWLPLIVAMPIHEASAVFSSSWFPAVILVTLLIRIALAFTVLSLAKERQEMEQRVDALTDPLTGLPNRRALFEAADAIGQRRILGGTPVAVLLFDLDHFKETNDSFGHELGDSVLKLFAATVARHLNGPSIVGRLGGEEFAAILPGADAATAVGVAEAVRRAFARSAAFVNGLAVGATVSVGAASDVNVDNDLSGLLRRADAALYVAKRAGRNRVALLERDDETLVPGTRSTVRTSPSRLKPVLPIMRTRPISIV